MLAFNLRNTRTRATHGGTPRLHFFLLAPTNSRSPKARMRAGTSPGSHNYKVGIPYVTHLGRLTASKARGRTTNTRRTERLSRPARSRSNRPWLVFRFTAPPYTRPPPVCTPGRFGGLGHVLQNLHNSVVRIHHLLVGGVLPFLTRTSRSGLGLECSQHILVQAV